MYPSSYYDRFRLVILSLTITRSQPLLHIRLMCSQRCEGASIPRVPALAALTKLAGLHIERWMLSATLIQSNTSNAYPNLQKIIECRARPGWPELPLLLGQGRAAVKNSKLYLDDSFVAKICLDSLM